MRVWTIDLDALAPDLSRFSRWLSAAERECLERLRSARARRRRTAARAALRAVLGQVLGVAPADVAIDREPSGKPRLVDSPLAFSLSHSDRLALIAVAPTGALGVDVERIAPRPRLDGIAARRFAAGDNRALAGLEGDERLVFFYRAWTAYEARLKAGEPAEVRHLDPAPGFVASVAAPGSDWRPIAEEPLDALPAEAQRTPSGPAPPGSASPGP